MKHKLFVIFLFPLAVLTFLNCSRKDQPIVAMTFNIRYDAAHDGDNVWQNRKDGLTDLLIKHKPDVIGIQEGQSHQINFIKRKINSYKMIGVDREKNGESEFSSIFYNSKNLTLVKSNTFWLSETPSIPSLGWDASFKRICTYGVFKTKKTKQEFLVFNTHLDHMGEKARIQSALLIIKKIKEINTKKLSVILMGDFNCEPNSEPINGIKGYLNDGVKLSKTSLTGPMGTFNGFDLNPPLDKRIDYIFVDKFEVDSYSHIDSKILNGNWPSDHLPVITKLIISN